MSQPLTGDPTGEGVPAGHPESASSSCPRNQCSRSLRAAGKHRDTGCTAVRAEPLGQPGKVSWRREALPGIPGIKSWDLREEQDLPGTILLSFLSPGLSRGGGGALESSKCQGPGRLGHMDTQTEIRNTLCQDMATTAQY